MMMRVLLLVALLCGAAFSVPTQQENEAVEEVQEQVEQVDDEPAEDVAPEATEEVDDPAVYQYHTQTYVSKPVVTHQVVGYTYSSHSSSSHSVNHGSHSGGSSSSSHHILTGHRRCPATNPYAYYNGQYCCKYGSEKVYRPQGYKCDGSAIALNSLCCYQDAHKKCPYGTCTNYNGRPYPVKYHAPAPACSANIYQHDKYHGRVDHYNSNTRMVRRNDDASSVKPSKGCCVILFEHRDFRGKQLRLCTDTPNLHGFWNDRMSSLKVERKYQLRG